MASRFSRKSIEALAVAISGGSAYDRDSPVPVYRQGWKIEAFFEEHGWDVTLAGDSRLPFTRETLLAIQQSPDGDESIEKLLVAAVDPRDFAGHMDDLAVVVDYLNTFLRFDGFELYRSGPGHALRGFLGDPLAAQEPTGPFPYDVALSYAGEDRDYVDQVAAALVEAGLTIFYDRYEEVGLWGKNLQEHLQHVFQRLSRYCIMFISASYARKVWPTLERRAAFAGAMERGGEYVLPARFDDTEVPGLDPSIKYEDLRARTPVELAGMIIAKLGID